MRLNEGKKLSDPGGLYRKYAHQRVSAGLRGIGWEITFAEWISVWRESGFLARRGRGAGNYCMARHGDVGPYKVSNVSIQLNEINNRDGRAGVKETSQTKTRLIGTGRGWTYRPKAAKPFQVMLGAKYIGSFFTAAEAEAAYSAAAAARIEEVVLNHSAMVAPVSALHNVQKFRSRT